jgi:hypothetical protein
MITGLFGDGCNCLPMMFIFGLLGLEWRHVLEQCFFSDQHHRTTVKHIYAVAVLS